MELKWFGEWDPDGRGGHFGSRTGRYPAHHGGTGGS